MKNNLKFVVTAIFLFNMVFLLNGCSQSPTGLGEALIKITPPIDGSWSGTTSQQENIKFSVLEDGTKVSGLSITIYISETWGYGEITYKPPNICTVVNDEFEIFYDFFGVTGKFNNAVDCSGTFYCDDYVYEMLTDSTYIIYPFSASGSWTAGLYTEALIKNISQNIEHGSFIINSYQKDNCQIQIKMWIKDSFKKKMKK